MLCVYKTLPENYHSKTRHKLIPDTFLYQINKYSYNTALETYYCISQRLLIFVNFYMPIFNLTTLIQLLLN